MTLKIGLCMSIKHTNKWKFVYKENEEEKKETLQEKKTWTEAYFLYT